MDLICDRFCFGEVQENVLAQCSGQGISVLRTKQICLSVVCSRKKQAGWLRKCPCEYSTGVSRFDSGILGKSEEKAEVIASVILLKCVTFLENLKVKNEDL